LQNSRLFINIRKLVGVGGLLISTQTQQGQNSLDLRQSHFYHPTEKRKKFLLEG